MKPIVIIRHVDYERLGWIPELLEELNIPFLSISLSKGEDFPVLSEISGAISMGGPMSAYEIDDFPFISEEMVFQKKLVENKISFLGICLGAQILCQSFGAKIIKSEAVELGWLPLKKLPESNEDPVFHELEIPSLFQLHYDVSELPEGAVRLLSSDVCDNQAFRLTDGVYGIQFHPETNPEMISSVVEEYRVKVDEDQLKLIRENSTERSQNGRIFLKELLRRIFSS